MRWTGKREIRMYRSDQTFCGSLSKTGRQTCRAMELKESIRTRRSTRRRWDSLRAGFHNVARVNTSISAPPANHVVNQTANRRHRQRLGAPGASVEHSPNAGASYEGSQPPALSGGEPDGTRVRMNKSALKSPTQRIISRCNLSDRPLAKGLFGKNHS